MSINFATLKGLTIPILPKGYTQVEYIESTGTQYIDTGLSLPQGFRIKGKLLFTSGTPDISGVFGAERFQSGAFAGNYFLRLASSANWGVQAGAQWSTGGISYTNVEYEFDVRNILGWPPYIKINGENIPLTAEGKENMLRSPDSCYLFACNYNGSPNYLANYRHLGAWEIYNEKSKLVRNFVPCKNASGEVGLYDLVNSKFYGNAGSGTFSDGADYQFAVKQIADASGRVLWSSTIKFTINGDTYIADRGMTWAAWFASSYNTTGETKGDIKDANGNEVSLDAVIVDGTVYEVGFGSGEATLTVDIGAPDSSGYSVTVTVNAPFPNSSLAAMMGTTTNPPVALTGGMSGSWSYPVPVGTVIEFSSYHSVYLNGTQVSISTYVVNGDVTVKTINQNQRRIYITEE